MRPLTLATLVCLISVPLSTAGAQETQNANPSQQIVLYQPTPPTLEQLEVEYRPSMQELMNNYQAPMPENAAYERERFFRMNNSL